MQKTSLSCDKKKAPVRRDILCENCTHVEATTLLYWERYHQDTGKTSLINPSIVCDHCKKLFIGTNGRFQDKPRLIPFDAIANQWDARMQGLTSKSLWDFSIFRNPHFKKKLWRIRFASQPEKNKP